MADNNQMREILDKLDDGVKSLFDSDKYAEYLSVMSRFHNYSTRNTLLIYAQYPEARHIAGYRSWQHNFNRQVKKGEHGIKILAPLPFAETKEFEKLDPETKQPILDDNGSPVMETLMRMGARFKTVSVFDVSQTQGEPLPELIEPLTGDVERYELFLDTLRAVSPLPISIEDMPSDTDGICYFGERLAIRAGMSQAQTISAIIHEMAHAKMHDVARLDADSEPKPKRVEEIEAESVSYVVCQRFSVETGANSFGYVSTWLKSAESKDLQNALDTIRKTAATMIDSIDEKYRILAKERGIDLSVVPQPAAEIGSEQNYNMIDGVINNKQAEPEQMANEPQTDPIREQLATLSQAETPDEKYKIAFAVLVDALCANEELLSVAATGEGWQKGAGRAALFNGGYLETLLDTYSAELADLLADDSFGNRLRNTVRGEAYRRLDAIAYDRYILDEYADITKSGRLETYETPYPEESESKGVFVHLTERLPDGGIHDYGTIFGYDPSDTKDHSINNYLSLKSFALLRESVFGKPESTITLNYKETEPVGSTVLRRLLYTDGMFNRELKRTRVEVLPPMGKYSVYAQHLSGVIGDDTLIHVGTDSGYLLPLGVSRTRFEEQFIEVQIDSIFEKAPVLLDNALADSEQFARFEWGAITGRFEEIEQHNDVYKNIRAEKDRERREEISAQQTAANKEAKHRHTLQIKENAGIIESGGNFKIDTMTYTGRNNLLELFALYDIDVPLATKGWFNNKLVGFEVSESGGYSYRSYQNKGKRTSYMGDAAYKKLRELRAAIKEIPIAEKLADKGLLVDENLPAAQNNESKDGGENMEYSELQKKGFEYAQKHAHLPLKERLDIIAGAFGLKSASVYVQPCTGKYRGQSDIMLKLEGGGTIGIGMRGNAAAKKDSTISECVNNALAKYNPEIVAEAKARASVALKAREAEDNYNAEQRGFKPYKFLNVELSDGGIGNGHTGWYYATIAIDNKIVPFVTSDLASDIARGVLTEYINRANYFVAGGLKDEDVDFVFNNVGHSSVRDSYTVMMSAEARERAEKTLAALQPDKPDNSVYAKYCNIVAERAGQYAVSSGTLLKKDVGDARSACDQIVNRVVNDLLLEAGEHYPLFKQYMSDPDFKARLEDYSFIKAYLEPVNAERNDEQAKSPKVDKTASANYKKFAELFPDIVDGKYSYIRLESGGFEPLSVEWIGDNRISIMHTYTQEGDLMYDPMMTFDVDREARTMTAFEYQMSMPPLYQRVDKDGGGQSIDGNGHEKHLRNLRMSLDGFASEWFGNIEQQGFIPVRANLIIGDEETQITFTADGKPIMPEADMPEQSTPDITLPDPTVSIADMKEYGYTDEIMVPMSESIALEMYDSNQTVYLLYPDNTESMALERGDIEQFDGLFGIEKPDWEHLQALKTPVVTENSRESELLHNAPGMFGIYQIRDGIENARGFSFTPMRELEALGLSVDRANYELVHTVTLDIHDTQTNLHKIFADFQAENPERPADYAGRSISVSDVIVLQWRGEVSVHYVDSVGFKELPHFTGEEREQQKTPDRETHHAEKQTFSQLDKRSTASKGKPDFLAKIEANKQRVTKEIQSPLQKNAEREVLT